MPSMPSQPTSLFPAVFRSIPFEATGIDRDHGVSLVTHEFTNRDEPYNEPMRRKTRTWSFRGVLTGEAAPALRDRLIVACETKTPGVLWHQNIGLATVYCTSCRPHEAAGEGLYTTWFDLEFVEAGGALPVSHLVSITLGAKLALMDAAMGIAYAVTADGTAARQTLTASAIAATAAELADRDVGDAIDKKLTAIVAQAGVLAADADATTEAWQDLFAEVTDPDDARALVASTAAIYADDDAIFNLMAHLSALSICAALTETETFTAWDDAVAARDYVVDLLAAAGDTVVDADLYAAITDARGRFAETMNDAALALPRLRAHSQVPPLPALVVAHRLYGDATRVDELLSRNAFADPNLIAGELRVLAE
jgi:prophage DNA circulation protein